MLNVVLDTHIWVSWMNNKGELSNTAAQVINDTLNNGAKVLVSCISAWEVAMLVSKRRLMFSMDVEAWLNQATQVSMVRFVPVDNKIACKSTILPGNFHKDPADRIIVATAQESGVPLVTKDKKIIDYKHVTTIPG